MEIRKKRFSEMYQRKHCVEAELPADTGSRRMTKADTDRKADRINAMIRAGCLIFLLVMTRMSTAAETLPAEEGEMEKISVRIVLRPEKEQGDPDPDLTEAVRTQIREQVGDDPDLLDRLCSCVEWTYAYDDEIRPPGEMRAAGESDILLTFAEDPEYVFEGWTFPDEGQGITEEAVFPEEEPAAEAGSGFAEEGAAQTEEYTAPDAYTETEEYADPVEYEDPESFVESEEYAAPDGYAEMEEYAAPDGYAEMEEYADPDGYAEVEGLADPAEYEDQESFVGTEEYTVPEDFNESDEYTESENKEDLRSFLTTLPREEESAENEEKAASEKQDVSEETKQDMSKETGAGNAEAEAGEDPEAGTKPDPEREEVTSEEGTAGEAAEAAETAQKDFHIKDEPEEEFHIEDERGEEPVEEETGTEQEVSVEYTSDEKNAAPEKHQEAYAVPQELTESFTELIRDPETETAEEAEEAEVQTQVQLLRMDSGSREEDLTDMFREALSGTDPEQLNWETLLAPLPENDGTYVLRTTQTDGTGKETVEETAFSINRFGSVYTYNDAIQALRGNTVRSVERALVISEYNPDAVREDSREVSLTLDGKKVSQVLYTVSQAGKEEDSPSGTEKNGVTTAKKGRGTVSEEGSSEVKKWKRYDYVIAPENFQEDGVYSLTVSSSDTAGNTSEMHRYNGGGISFTVDGSPPELQAVQGLENAVVNGRKADVRVTAFDTVGLTRLSAFVDGKLMATEETFADRHRAELAFSISQGPAQRVRIVAEDTAGNVLDTDEKTTDEEYTFRPAFPFSRQITVTPPPVQTAPKPKGPVAILLLLIAGCTGVSAVMLRRIFRKENNIRRAGAGRRMPIDG